MKFRLSLSLTIALLVGAFTFNVPLAGWAARSEMIVTTRKTAENIQDVPISIYALSAEDLEQQSILNISDLSLSTPGLSIEQQGAGGFATPVIRGMAQNVIGTDLSYDNNVGIFVNGVYQSGRNTVDLELVGIDRIEVARGPQSALFGRSTFAGAINYVFAVPTDEFTGNVSATAGTDEDYGLTVDVGGPILGDQLKGRVSAGYREFDGTFKNLAGGENLQGYESFSTAAALLWTPTDNFSATLNLLYSDRTNEQDAQFLVDLNCGSAMFTGAPTYFCGELKAPGDVDLSPEGEAENQVSQYSLNLEYEAEGFTLTSITAYTATNYEAILDRDYGSLAQGTGLSLDVCSLLGGCFVPPPGGPIVIRTDMGVQSYAHSGSDTDDISQEFRIASSGTDNVRWMAGLFIYDSETSTSTRASLGNSLLGPTETYTGFFAPPFLVDDPATQSEPFNIFEANTQAWAIFGQVSWDITEQLTFTAEGRYTDEEKTTNIIYNFAPTNESYMREFEYITPRFTLEFKPMDDQLVYLSAAKGVRTGGINGGVTGCPSFNPALADPAVCAAAQADERFFEPEKNWTYELGTKSLFWDNRLVLNTALYYTDWSDIQLPALNADLFGTHVVNASGGAEIWGLELETIIQLTDMVQISAGYAYTDPEFENGTLDGSVVTSCGVGGDLCTIVLDDNGRPAADVGGQTLGRTADHQANVGLNLTGALTSELSWYAQTNINYQSENYARSINQLTYGERTLVNFRAAVLNETFELAIWAKNLFDEDYVASQALQPGLDGNRRIDAYQGNGARFGVTGIYKF